MHSIVTTEQPHVLRSALAYNRERVGRNTRQSDNLSMPRVKNNHGKRRFMYRTVKKYNEFVITPGLAKLSRRPFKSKNQRRNPAIIALQWAREVGTCYLCECVSMCVCVCHASVRVFCRGSMNSPRMCGLT